MAPRWGDVDLDIGKVRVERSIEQTASGLRFFLTISRRLGHASPTITLNVYGHLFANSDNRAADVVEAAFGKALTENTYENATDTNYDPSGGNPVTILQNRA